MVRHQADTSRSIAAATSHAIVGISIILVPQAILRAASFGNVGLSVFVAFLLGFGAFVVVLYAIRQVTLAVPRRSVQQLVYRRVGTWAGLAVAAARILAIAMLAMLGVELMVSTLGSIFDLKDFAKPLAALMMLLLAIPVLADRLTGRITGALLLVGIGVLATVAVVGFGLFQEALGALNLEDITSARTDAYDAKYNAGRYHPYIETTLGACFSAAILFIISERIMVTPDERRVGTRQLLRNSMPALVIIALTMYLAIILQLPGRRLGIPVLSMAFAFFGTHGQQVVGVILALTGVAVTYAAYRQLPRLLRELAVDGLLPRRLAAQDAVRPRRLIVLVIAVTTSIAITFLDSTRSIAMVFTFMCFAIGLAMSWAMIARSATIRNDSTDAAERREAMRLLWIFIGFGIFCLTILGAIVYVQPMWALAAVICLVGPVAFLATFRKDQGRVSEALALSGENRETLPVRVHGIVLIDQLDQPAMKAIVWARAMRLSSLQAVRVDVDSTQTKNLRRDWLRMKMPVALTVLGTPKGAARGPIVEYVRSMRQLHPRDLIVVIAARVIWTDTWRRFFLKHTTPQIISELRLEPGVMLVEVPYRMDDAQAATFVENELEALRLLGLQTDDVDSTLEKVGTEKDS